jgi:hypothetical protein
MFAGDICVSLGNKTVRGNTRVSVQEWSIKDDERAQDMEGIKTAGLGTIELAARRRSKGDAWEATEKRTSGVLRMAGGEAESAERSEGEPDVERNGMEERLKRLPRRLAE